MEVTVSQLVIWIVIAALVGLLGELIARRRTPAGIIGAALLGFLGIFLVVGLFHFKIAGEPTLEGIPIISSIITAAILVLIWSGLVYRRVYRV